MNYLILSTILFLLPSLSAEAANYDIFCEESRSNSEIRYGKKPLGRDVSLNIETKFFNQNDVKKVKLNYKDKVSTELNVGNLIEERTFCEKSNSESYLCFSKNEDSLISKVFINLHTNPWKVSFSYKTRPDYMIKLSCDVTH